MWEHVKWTHKKAKTFQAKEAQCHKQNYDKRSKAGALEVGDMVLVYVTAFKGCHKLQNWWENREYVVKRQPYPNVPVYVVFSRDGDGCCQTLYRNYLLSISPNIEQNEKDALMAGVEHTSTSAPAPSVDSEPADTEPSGMATSDTTGNISQGSQDQSAPLRCGTHTTQNQLPWGTITLDCWLIPVCLTSGLHGLVCVFVFILYHVCTLFSWGV